MKWQELFTVIQAISALSFLFTAAITLKIYYMQRNDSAEVGRRDARVRLTRAYFQFNVEVLHSKDITSVMRELIYPQYTAPQVERIEFMFMMLNTLFLEWHFYKDHTQSKEAFESSMASWMDSLARSVQSSRLVKKLKRAYSHNADGLSRRMISSLTPENHPTVCRHADRELRGNAHRR
jgi:hypothetical protein